MLVLALSLALAASGQAQGQVVVADEVRAAHPEEWDRLQRGLRRLESEALRRYRVVVSRDPAPDAFAVAQAALDAWDEDAAGSQPRVVIAYLAANGRLVVLPEAGLRDRLALSRRALAELARRAPFRQQQPEELPGALLEVAESLERRLEDLARERDRVALERSEALDESRAGLREERERVSRALDAAEARAAALSREGLDLDADWAELEALRGRFSAALDTLELAPGDGARALSGIEAALGGLDRGWDELESAAKEVWTELQRAEEELARVREATEQGPGDSPDWRWAEEALTLARIQRERGRPDQARAEARALRRLLSLAVPEAAASPSREADGSRANWLLLGWAVVLALYVLVRGWRRAGELAQRRSQLASLRSATIQRADALEGELQALGESLKGVEGELPLVGVSRESLLRARSLLSGLHGGWRALRQAVVTSDLERARAGWAAPEGLEQGARRLEDVPVASADADAAGLQLALAPLAGARGVWAREQGQVRERLDELERQLEALTGLGRAPDADVEQSLERAAELLAEGEVLLPADPQGAVERARTAEEAVEPVAERVTRLVELATALAEVSDADPSDDAVDLPGVLREAAWSAEDGGGLLEVAAEWSRDRQLEELAGELAGSSAALAEANGHTEAVLARAAAGLERLRAESRPSPRRLEQLEVISQAALLGAGQRLALGTARERLERQEAELGARLERLASSAPGPDQTRPRGLDEAVGLVLGRLHELQPERPGGEALEQMAAALAGLEGVAAATEALEAWHAELDLAGHRVEVQRQTLARRLREGDELLDRQASPRSGPAALLQAARERGTEAERRLIELPLAQAELELALRLAQEARLLLLRPPPGRRAGNEARAEALDLLGVGHRLYGQAHLAALCGAGLDLEAPRRLLGEAGQTLEEEPARALDLAERALARCLGAALEAAQAGQEAELATRLRALELELDLPSARHVAVQPLRQRAAERRARYERLLLGVG